MQGNMEKDIHHCFVANESSLRFGYSRAWRWLCLSCAVGTNGRSFGWPERAGYKSPLRSVGPWNGTFRLIERRFAKFTNTANMALSNWVIQRHNIRGKQTSETYCLALPVSHYLLSTSLQDFVL